MKKAFWFLAFIFMNSLVFANKVSDYQYDSGIYSFPKLYEQTKKATVAIKVYYDSSLDENVSTLSKFWYGNYCEEKGLGSGFIFTEDGYILTNHHVAEAGNYYEVYFSDDTHIEGELIGSDERSDIAILKVDLSNLPYLQLETEDIQIGQWIYVVGNPLAIQLQNSLSVGIVSGKNRFMGEDDIENDIQLDINVNSGNSGSPVLNLNGRVIGMVKSAIDSEFGSGIAFIIPNSTLNKISAQLIKNGQIIEGRFGFEGIVNKDHFINITKVEKDSSAFKADLQKGDLILEYNGIEIKTVDAFLTYIKLMDIDEILRLKIKRGDEILFKSLKKEKI